MSYQKDPALFDSFKIPHQVVVVVNDTVWASELASLSTNKCLFTALTGQHNKINLRPAGKVGIIHFRSANDNIRTVYFYAVL